MKVINVRCEQCNKTFKAYGKYDSKINNCKSHNKTKRKK